MNSEFEELSNKLMILESELQNLYAQSVNAQYGKFIPELSLAEFNFTDEEIEALCSVSLNDDNSNVELKMLARMFLQTWYHEYCHFYQQITLRGVRKFARIRKNKLKAETAILIKAAELECVWDLRDKNQYKIHTIVQHKNFPPHDFPGGEIKKHLQLYLDEATSWKSKKNDEVSFLEIIEGMAHCFSKFLFNFEDFLGLDDEHIYSNAYNYFIEKGGGLIEGRITRDFMFCYICYFSLKEEDVDATLLFFVESCEHLLDCIKAMKKKQSAGEMKLLIDNFSIWLGRDHTYNDAKLEALGQFIGSIHYLKNVLKTPSNSTNGFGENEFTIDEKAIIDFSIPKGVGINEEYLLLLFIAFPGSFFIWSQKLRDPDQIKFSLVEGNQKIALSQEQELSKFVLNFKALINPFLPNAWCCEKHGSSANESTILHCDNDDSFASVFYDLTGSKLYDCVHLPKM